MKPNMIIDLVAEPQVLNAIAGVSPSAKFGARVVHNADEEEVELLIFEQIGKDPWFGDGVGAKDVARFLADHKGKAVNVRINSPGGSVFDGITIHNALVQHDAKVTATIEGVAASAAGIVAVAADRVKIFENASFMMHRASTIAWGNVDTMLEVGELLTKIDDQIARTLGAKAGRSRSEILGFMKGKGKHDGTWLSAKEARDLGVVDEVIPVRNDKAGARNLTEDEVRASQQAALTAEVRNRLAEIDRGMVQDRLAQVPRDLTATPAGQ